MLLWIHSMPRKIIIVDRIKSDQAFQVRAAFWLTPPASPRPMGPPTASIVTTLLPGEQGAINNGTVVERVFTSGFFAEGTAESAVQASLVSKYNEFQAAIDAELEGHASIGASWNGTTWS